MSWFLNDAHEIAVPQAISSDLRKFWWTRSTHQRRREVEICATMLSQRGTSHVVIGSTVRCASPHITADTHTSISKRREDRGRNSRQTR